MSALGGDDHASALRAFGDSQTGTAGIVIVSAHWQDSPPIRVTAWESAPLIYDFGGFPPELYRIQYPAKGSPQLAGRVVDLLHSAALEPARGLDHGAWVPLRLAWPNPPCPVVQVSLPIAEPEPLFRLGEALRPLRDEGVIVIGSGGIVHNLSRVNLGHKKAPVEQWAADFDSWVANEIVARRYDNVFAYRTSAPYAGLAVPSSEHFDPLFVTLGAGVPDDGLRTIFEGFQYGNLSMRSFSLDRV